MGRLLKRVFVSYTFSLPLMALGLTLFVELNSSSLPHVIMADSDINLSSVRLLLTITGAICFLLGLSSIVTRYLTKER